MAQQLLVDQGFLIIKAARSHPDTPHSEGILRTSDHYDAETSTWQHSQETHIHDPGGIRTTMSAGERPQTYALDRAASGTGVQLH
jgi:hypothetical protein